MFLYYVQLQSQERESKLDKWFERLLKLFYESFHIKAWFLEIARTYHKGCYRDRKWEKEGTGINNHWLRKKIMYVICNCPVFNILYFILLRNFWLVTARSDALFYPEGRGTKSTCNLANPSSVLSTEEVRIQVQLSPADEKNETSFHTSPNSSVKFHFSCIACFKRCSK